MRHRTFSIARATLQSRLNPQPSWLLPLLAVSTALLFVQCRAMGWTLPPLEEQKAQIQQDRIQLQSVGPRAFLETWGAPAYMHRERMQFYPVKSGNFVPRFRLPTGEVPNGWDSTIVSEESIFFGYPDRGELLGFISDRLIYREAVPAEEVHAIGKMWKRDALFKTRLETGIPP